MDRARTRTRTLVLASTAALAVSAWSPGVAAPLAGSAGDATYQQASDACGTDPITLDVWGGYAEMEAVYSKAGEAFTALHPNVSFTIYESAGDLRGFETKLVTALPTNTAGDVIVRTTNFLARFIDGGLFQPLPDDLEAAVTGGDYHPAVVQDSTYADDIWGLPIFTGGTGIFYNTAMYEAAGITEPPTSMEALIENAYKTFKVDEAGVTNPSGWSHRLLGQGSGVAEKFWILLLQYGNTLIKETEPGSGLWVADYNGENGVKLFQMYVDMLRDGVDSLNAEHDAAAFEKGVTAQFLRESWVVADIAANAPDLQYATVAPPTADILTVEGAFVPDASPDAACAWEFIRFLREPAQQQDVIQIAGWLPARQGLDFTELLASNPGFSGFLTGREDLALTVTPPLPEFDEIETKLAEHLVAGYADYANLAGNPEAIQTLLNEWAAESNQILQDNGHFGG
jgi:multiple sugar transport system substrate-binding protein